MSGSKINFYNLILHQHNTASALSECRRFLLDDKNNIVVFINSHCFNIAQENSEYLHVIHSADLVLNDGIGIKIASILKGITIQENLNGTDFIPKIIELAYKEKKKIFLLGGKENVANKAKEIWEERFPGINITGTRSGYFSKEEETSVVAKINRSGAEVLIVGMGVPRQEIWLYKQKNNLSNVKISVAGGAILDFTAGRIKRAPKFMRKVGMEWFFRLLSEPKRLFARYTIGNIRFFIHLIEFMIFKKQPKKALLHNMPKNGSSHKVYKKKQIKAKLKPTLKK